MKRNYLVLTAIALILGFTLFGCKKSEPETLTPKIKNDKVETTATTATFTWTVDWPGKLVSVVEVSENEDMSDSEIYGSETETENHDFKVTATDLEEGMKYYYRYLVWNHHYVDNKFVLERNSIMTKNVPSVITAENGFVGYNTAVWEGDVISDGGSDVTECGLCWSTNHNPTIVDNHISSVTGTNSFMISMTGLNASTTYYVRAYAINIIGTGYGDEVSFTTFSNSISGPVGAINGQFTVNGNGKKVYFSKGNLQYKASSNTWRFAENQWDFVGTQNPEVGNEGGTVSGSDNACISQTYNGWIDMFGWGTSGYNHGAVCYRPWCVSDEPSDYFAYGALEYNLHDQGGKADWGYNAISNGGNRTNTWRTLTKEEWDYVITDRNTTSGTRYAKAIVNGVNGLVLLPDNWSPNNNILHNTNQSGASFDSNVISALQWNTLESLGAVFLPAAGRRNITMVIEVGEGGICWSASCYNRLSSYQFDIIDSFVGTEWFAGIRNYGQSVRLVRDVE